MIVWPLYSPCSGQVLVANDRATFLSPNRISCFPIGNRHCQWYLSMKIRLYQISKRLIFSENAQFNQITQIVCFYKMWVIKFGSPDPNVDRLSLTNSNFVCRPILKKNVIRICIHHRASSMGIRSFFSKRCARNREKVNFITFLLSKPI